MKKSIAVILLGSALLLPNNNNVEASYANNDVQVQQYVQTIGWEDLQNFSNNMNGKIVINGYQIDLSQFINKYANKNWDAYGQSYKYHGNKGYYQKQAPVEIPEEVKPPVQAPVEKPAPAPAPVKKPAAPAPVEKPVALAPAPKPAPAPAPVEKPAPAPVAKPAPAQNASISAIEQAVLDLTNAERQKAGLSPLQIDKNLMNSARQKSTDMATKNYFSHTSPTYGSPFDQMKANGVSYRAAAENIAMGQQSAKEVVQAWMDSPGHRENILTPNYTHIGIGFDANGNYWTQQFIQK